MLTPVQFDLPNEEIAGDTIEERVAGLNERVHALIAALLDDREALNAPNVLKIAAAEISETSIRGTRVVTAVATGSNRNLAVSETRVAFTNEGATARQDLTLPTAVAGLEYAFYCADTDGIRVIANTGDTIRIAGSVSAAAGRIDSTTIGSSVVLLAINATEWVALASLGTWVVT